MVMNNLRNNYQGQAKLDKFGKPLCTKCRYSSDGHMSVNCPFKEKKFCYGCNKYVTDHIKLLKFSWQAYKLNKTNNL